MNQKLFQAEKITVLIIDLDNTLWSGTLAEKQNLVLNEDLFHFLKELYQKGIQIFIVSRNGEEDVFETLKNMGIDSDLFTAIIANWDPKYLNISRLLETTRLRAETVIFLDDNDLELTEVKKKIPQIHCVNSSQWPVLKEIPFFKKKEKQSDTEIQERINRYKTAIYAGVTKDQYKEPEDFLRSLKRELTIGEIASDNLERFTELLVMTHRINFNPEKFHNYNETLDYLYYKINEGYKLYVVSTKENTISLGLTGAFVVDIQRNQRVATVIDGTFSCGIIGRDFEQKAILGLMELLKKDVDKLIFPVAQTSTNIRVQEIFEELGVGPVANKNGITEYVVETKHFSSPKTYDWIKIHFGHPEMVYSGIPSIIHFFEEKIKVLIKEGFTIANLGSAHGEVLGQLKKETREAFSAFLKEKKVLYTKIDLEKIPGENNIVANAENLGGILGDESQDMVWAFELLEHTEHFWSVINEMIRICKVGGCIIITVPTFHFPKHEYPIDLWRIGPVTLKSFFPPESFSILHFETEGQKENPRRCMIMVKKEKQTKKKYDLPPGGETNWSNGLTVFA